MIHGSAPAASGKWAPSVDVRRTFGLIRCAALRGLRWNKFVKLTLCNKSIG